MGEKNPTAFEYATLQIIRGEAEAYRARLSSENGELRLLDQHNEVGMPLSFDYGVNYSPGQLVDSARKKILDLKAEGLVGNVQVELKLTIESVRRA